MLPNSAVRRLDALSKENFWLPVQRSDARLARVPNLHPNRTLHMLHANLLQPIIETLASLHRNKTSQPYLKAGVEKQNLASISMMSSKVKASTYKTYNPLLPNCEHDDGENDFKQLRHELCSE